MALSKDKIEKVCGGLFIMILNTLFNSLKKDLILGSKVDEVIENKNSGKWFGIVYALTGITIFIVVNVLKWTNHFKYFIPSFALIIGLHFFPLAKIFKRKFDYYMGAWTCLISIIGIYLITRNSVSNDAIVAFVGIGCAISTSTYGLRMVLEAKKQMKPTYTSKKKLTKRSHFGNKFVYLLNMRVIAIKTLKDYIDEFHQAEQALLSWHEEAVSALWNNPNELKAQYKNASILNEKRVVFNIHGNSYRLIVDIEYRLKIVFIKEYDNALAHVYELMQTDVVEGSVISDELEILSLLIKEYELVHYPVSYPNPIEAIKFRMDQMNLSENELSDLLGTRSRKSEILSGKRKLSLSMIRKLTDVLHIPAEVLIQAY
eukprot:gene17015-20404_t